MRSPIAPHASTPAVLRALAARCSTPRTPRRPATRPIATELHLSIAAAKSRLHGPFERFEPAELPQNRKRAQLAADALRAGLAAPEPR